MNRKHIGFDIPWPKQFKTQVLGRILRPWLPSRGNALFSILLVTGLLWATNAGALPLGRPSVAGPSTSTIAYQGRLASTSGTPVTATVGMEFRLYSAASGGVPLWAETWTGSNSVQVSDGLFNVMLGSLSAVPQSIITANSSLWLGITVGTDGEMSPRVQLGSVPYATQALTVPDSAITSAKIADGAVASADLANNAVTTAKLADGNVTNTKVANGAIDRTKLAPMTGVVWKVPSVVYIEEGTAWSTTQNATWDISSYLSQAGVPANAELILMTWRPSTISDHSSFELLNSNDQILGSVMMGTYLPNGEWAAVGLEYGSVVAVPGATRKIRYSDRGGYQQTTTNLRRSLTIVGWK